MEFIKFFWQIGLMGKIVLFVLILMSILSWYYIFYNYFIFYKFRGDLSLWTSKLELLKELAPFIREVKTSSEDYLAPSFKRFLAKFGEIYDFYKGGKTGEESLRSEAEREIEEIALLEQERMLIQLGRGLGFLATTASVAPFIGLFGTVWGIMKAFHDIGQKGSASLAIVAPGIAEALVNTAMGLLVAIPSALAYNYFILKRDRIIKEVELLFRKITILTKRELLKD
ncbi:MAG: MotA/TolQ/ExbB proton channel family protein [Caldimicrobium sp.]|nr:MotA/TolQ/ExbB proton channel family protein [Caldimicrobium sp.]MCX7873031.1 MotA/TolQ/ExbB proton channel family protein [Caldimicrobium sp.]MDW8094846.1 MotA/TolQ/ExbB proton channel family protein [Caldimicrobium sp.]